MASAPPASTPGPAPASGRDNVVGIALIVGAVLIGLFLLVKGYDSEGGVVAADKVTTETTTATTAPVESTTTTTVATKPPADVIVKVANASGKSGVASSTRSTLQGKGYTQVSVGDAPSIVPSTQVLYVAGAQGEAQAVAAALGVDAAAVAPVPTPAPVALGDAMVLVLAGPDLA
jgi:hypothetical protein